jgi:hypothetical protein
MNDNLTRAAAEYLEKRDQLGARKAAAHVMQTYGVTSLALSERLRANGQLLSQQATAATTAASEVHYLGVPAREAVERARFA